MAAAIPSNWTFSGGTVPIVATAVSLSAPSTIRVDHTEPKGGESLTLTFPLTGIQSNTAVPFTGPPSLNFTSIGDAPQIYTLQVLDGTTLRLLIS